MRVYFYSWIFLIILYTSTSWSLTSDCVDFFKKNKIIPPATNCLESCLTVMVDMGSFMCPQQCDEYCKDPCKKILQDIEKKILSGQPRDWPLKEMSLKWSPSEIKAVSERISQVPDQIFEPGNFEFYRMAKSVDFPNPATNANTSPPAIVLYDTAFSQRYDLTRVIFHEMTHVFYQKMPASLKDNYNLKMNWVLVDPIKNRWISRKDSFVKENGKISAEEDFANNLEYFLFDSKKLREVNGNAFDWMKDQFNGIKLKKGCRYGN